MKNKKHQLKNKYFKHQAVVVAVILVLGLFLAYSNQPQNITGNVVLPASAQNNLKLYMKFEDTARDEVTGISGTESIGIGYASGSEGDAVSFSGGSEKYITLGERSDLVMTSGFTIHASIYPTGDGIIVNKEGEYEIALIGGKVKYAIGNPSPSVWTWIDTGYTATLNQWTNLTLNYSSVSGASLFINGNPVYAGGPNYPVGDDAPTQNEFRIGNRQGPEQQFHGKIDNVIVYNRALTITEVQQLNLQTPSTSIANGFKISNALTTQPNYLSFQATIKPSTVAEGWQAIIEQGSASSIGWHFYQNGKKLYVNIDNVNTLLTNDVILNVNAPYIVNFTKIGNTVTVYVNGQNAGTKTISNLNLLGDGVYIGIRKNGNQYPYQGQISGANLVVGAQQSISISTVSSGDISLSSLQKVGDFYLLPITVNTQNINNVQSKLFSFLTNGYSDTPTTSISATPSTVNFYVPESRLGSLVNGKYQVQLKAVVYGSSVNDKLAESSVVMVNIIPTAQLPIVSDNGGWETIYRTSSFCSPTENANTICTDPELPSKYDLNYEYRVLQGPPGSDGPRLIHYCTRILVYLIECRYLDSGTTVSTERSVLEVMTNPKSLRWKVYNIGDSSAFRKLGDGPWVIQRRPLGI